MKTRDELRAEVQQTLLIQFPKLDLHAPNASELVERITDKMLEVQTAASLAIQHALFSTD